MRERVQYRENINTREYFNERMGNPDIAERYIGIVRDQTLLESAREESIDAYRELYAQCHKYIPDEAYQKRLVEMAVKSYEAKWQEALDIYAQSGEACAINGDKGACESQQNREVQLGMIIAQADEVRHEMGRTPFVPEAFGELPQENEIVYIHRETNHQEVVLMSAGSSADL